MDNQQELYRLNAAVRVLEQPNNFFLSRFFPRIQDAEGDKITIDIQRRGRKLAPFVSHCVEGVPIANSAFETRTLSPAYIRLKDAPSQCNNGKRRFGQQPDQLMSAEQNLEFDTMDVLAQHEESIQERLEWMGAKTIVDGKYLVKSDHHPAYEVDFRRSAGNSIIVAEPWKNGAVLNSDASPIDDLTALGKVIYDGCGFKMTDIIMRTSTWQALSKHQDFNDLFMKIRGVNEGEIPNLTPKAYKKVQLMGKFVGAWLWIVEESFTNDQGALEYYVPDGKVIGVSDNGLQGFIGYGEIKNDKAVAAGLSKSTRFVDRFFEDNIGKLMAQTETAPLVAPVNPDASATMTVFA